MQIKLDGKTYETKPEDVICKMRYAIEGKRLLKIIDLDNDDSTIGNQVKEEKSFAAFKKFCDMLFTESYEGSPRWIDLTHKEVSLVVSFFLATLVFEPQKN